MDFAPYQDTDPERTRALSPPPPGNRALSPNSRTAARSPPPPRNQTRNPIQSSTLPAPSYYNDEYVPRGDTRGFGGGGGRGDLEGRAGVDVNLFETSLPLRLDHEAMLAYLLLPPVGGVILLIAEHKSDYVRYASSHPLLESAARVQDTRKSARRLAGKSRAWLTTSNQVSCLAVGASLHCYLRRFPRRTSISLNIDRIADNLPGYSPHLQLVSYHVMDHLRTRCLRHSLLNLSCL